MKSIKLLRTYNLLGSKVYYWNYKDIFILLTNEEVNEIILTLSDNDPRPLFYVYSYSSKVRKIWENKIDHHLKNYLKSSPKIFYKKYIFRSWYKEEAQKYFPMFLDAYGNATKLASSGSYSGDELLDNNMDGILFDQKEEIYHITLFNKSIVPRKIQLVNGRISFYAKNIEHIAGTVDNFILMTKNFNIRFGDKMIRISLHAK